MEIRYREKVTEEARRITETARNVVEAEYKRKAAEAEEEYRAKRDAVYGITVGSLLYGFFATLLTACNSPRIARDFSAFIMLLWELISGPIRLAWEACRAVWAVKDIIPYQIINVVTAVILAVITFVLITGLTYGSVGLIISEAGKFYHEEFWDLLSGVVALISMGILVWFADTLTMITWNLIYVWVLIHGGYILIRMIISDRNGSRR